MTASSIDICNMALSQLGAQNIASLMEASPEARACQQFYTNVRDGLLAGYPWGFARRDKALAEVVNIRVGAWTHAYSCPVDMLKVEMVRPPYAEGLGGDGGIFPYDLSGDIIYSNVAKAVMIYTGRVEDPALFPPLFVTAFAYHLSFWLAMPLTRSSELQGRMLQLAQNATGLAQMADANQTGHFYDDGLGLLEARGYD